MDITELLTGWDKNRHPNLLCILIAQEYRKTQCVLKTDSAEEKKKPAPRNKKSQRNRNLLSVAGGGKTHTRAAMAPPPILEAP